MSDWKDFFKRFLPDHTSNAIMVSFVNRYLEPMDDVKYKIRFDDQEIGGLTRVDKHSITIQTKTVNPVKVYVWTRRNKAFKLIDVIVPQVGKPQLVYEHMKSFKHTSKTQPHPLSLNQTTAPSTESHTPFKPAPGIPPTTNQGVNLSQTTNRKAEFLHQADRPIPDKITLIQLKKIFPKAVDDYLQQVADELNVDLKKYGLETPLRKAHFFAQVKEEAGDMLQGRVESMNHTPQSLKRFKYYQHHPLEALQDGRLDAPRVNGRKVKPLQAANQIAIANKAYAEKNGNDDVASGDGWRYRGRGFIQLTFKNNYKEFDSDYGSYWSDMSPGFVIHPEKAMDFPYKIRSAVWFWVNNKLSQIADKGSTPEIVDKITAVINFYTDSYVKRRAHFVITYAAFK